jgi:hypothetical protein
MPQIANSIPETSTEILTDVVQPHVVLNLSLSYQDLVEVITKLGLREIIQLKRLLDRQINQFIKQLAV